MIQTSTYISYTRYNIIVLNFFSKSKLTDEVFGSQKPVEFWNITNSPTSMKKVGNEKLKDFVDNSEVPPLE